MKRQATPTQRRRATRRRQAALTADDPHAQLAWADVRVVIHNRSVGRCEVCGNHLVTMEGHHRLTRRLGPNCPCNALALCHDCHHGDTVHGGPELARSLGRIISRHDVTAPYDVPVEVHGQGLVRLLCDGTYGAA